VRVLVTGAGGMLARAVVREAAARGHDVVSLRRADLDVTDADAVRTTVLGGRPDVVVQCAAYTRVDDAETDEAAAFAVNADGTGHVADACREAGARLVYPSTDYVFDGSATEPYAPDARTSPVNAYGRSKLAGEAAAARADALVVRTSWLYGPGGRNFVSTILARARAGAPLRVVDDQHGAPTSTLSLAVMMMGLLEHDAPPRIWHATDSGRTTWYGFAGAALELAGIDADITPCNTADFPTPARRPSWSVLDCSRTYALLGEAPEWRDALAAALQAGVGGE
jgi:dTDP-4-dehydrorhamnose reductase